MAITIGDGILTLEQVLKGTVSDDVLHVGYYPDANDGQGSAWYLPNYSILIGGGGDDILAGRQGIDEVYGGSGYDLIKLGRGPDYAEGNRGEDNITGGGGDDVILGGMHADMITGSKGNDTLFGNQGSDVLRGGRGDDVLHGGRNDDILDGGLDIDTVIASDGDDVVRGVEIIDLDGRELFAVIDGEVADQINYEGGTITLPDNDLANIVIIGEA